MITMTTFGRVSALCAAISVALLAAENPLVEKVDPEAAGMSAERLARIAPRMKEFVDAGNTAGVVTLVARHGHVASLDAVGFQNLESKTPMKTDSIFRIMSVTKPVTCAGVMVLVDQGRLSLLDPVEKFIPEFKGIRVNPCGTRNGFDCQLTPAQRPFTVLDLMTHTSGLGEAGGGRGGATPNSRAELIATSAQRMNLIFQPGTAWSYTNFGIGVLGRIIEVASGKSFDDFMAERILSPLGMKDTSFDVPAAKAGRVATVYTTENGKLTPLDRSQIRSGGISSPDSGLLTTAADLARFLQMMLNKGRLNGRTVLSAAAVETMTVSHTGTLAAGYTPGNGQGFGFEVVREPLGMFRYASIGTFEKAGFYRTYVWGDPAKDLLGVILMQRNTGGYQADVADEVNVFMAMAAAAIEK
ncbi:MAG: serine hydrolase domain-containing protein [Candidatus Solibacter sp.]